MFASCTPFFNRREMAWTAEFPDNDQKREVINNEMFFALLSDSFSTEIMQFDDTL
jgi:hypothetical protein